MSYDIVRYVNTAVKSMRSITATPDDIVLRHRPMSYDVVRSVNTALGYGLGHARTIFETPATPNRILDTRSTLTRIESVCNRYHAVSVFHYAEPSLVFVALFLQFCV